METGRYLMLRRLVNMNQDNSPQRVKVKLNVGGVEVEIEAPVDQLEESVRRVVAALAEGKAREERPAQESRRQLTCRQVVERLVSEGFFREPKTLSEVYQEVKRRGYSFDATAVAHVLLELVREEALDREGSPRRYQYVEKRRGLMGEVTAQGAEGLTQTAEERTAQRGTGVQPG
jgi:SOS response regulatory protein OraA/RecX